MGVMKMGNIVSRAGIEPTTLAFRVSVLTIAPPRLPACMCVCVYNSYVCLDVYMCICVHACLNLYLCMHECIYYVYKCIYACLYVFMYAYRYIYIYIYIYNHECML